MSHHPIHQANENSLFGGLSREEFYKKHKVLHHESFILNQQNMKIYTQTWRPEAADPASPVGLHGVVGLIHGYTNDSSWLLQLTAVAMAKLGFYVCALDLQGHGLSEGVRGHVPDIKPIVDDCVQYFDSVRSDYPGLPAFLYGESLGGAIAMLVCLRQSRTWAGLILSGSMCGVSTKFKPVWPLEVFLPLAATLFSSWKLAMTKPLASRSFKEEWKRRLNSKNPNRPMCRKPTMATALEFLRVCEEMRRRSKELETPLLVVHGEDDSVCDAESAADVFDTAASKDKTLHILPGMWHQLIGEPEEGVDVAFGIIFSWLRARADNAVLNTNGVGLGLGVQD